MPFLDSTRLKRAPYPTPLRAVLAAAALSTGVGCGASADTETDAPEGITDTPPPAAVEGPAPTLEPASPTDPDAFWDAVGANDPGAPLTVAEGMDLVNGLPPATVEALNAAGAVPYEPVPASGGAAQPLIRGPEPTEQSASQAGPFTVGSYTSGYEDGLSFADATVWYPNGAGAPYSLVAVVPGFVSPQQSIMSWGPFLASHGMAVITIGTNTGFDLPTIRKLALLDALESLAAENTRAGSALEGKLDAGRRAVMGWSMGGGGATEAASENPNLKAAIGLASWHVGYAPAGNQVPTLWFASWGDPLAGGQSQFFYTGTPQATPKMLIEWLAFDHWIANDPANRLGAVGRYGLSWLKVFLEEDERYRKFLVDPGDAFDFRSNL